MDRSPDERIANTYQPLLPWKMGILFGRLYGRLIALSMCRPTPEMVQDAIGAIGELPSDLVVALKSSSFRRRQRKAIKAELLPGLKVEANGHGCRLVRLFLTELTNSLYQRGYRPDEALIPKIDVWQAEYDARTQDLIHEISSDPGELKKMFPLSKTLGPIRAKNALPLLGGEQNYYQHLTSLIWEIRSETGKMKISTGHLSDIKKSLPPRLVEMFKLFSELKTQPINKEKMKVFVNNFIQLVDAGEEFHAIIPMLVRYFFIETIPSVPSDEETSHKRLSLIEGQIADGQESIGTWQYTSNGRKQIYKQATEEEPMEDGERLSKIASSAGIDLDDLTPGEQKRILELADAIDSGYENSSKTGMSYKDYYGSRADSEKTMRQRLFKKITRLSKL
jgi:hypothetical protein